MKKLEKMYFDKILSILVKNQFLKFTLNFLFDFFLYNINQHQNEAGKILTL